MKHLIRMSSWRWYAPFVVAALPLLPACSKSDAGITAWAGALDPQLLAAAQEVIARERTRPVLPERLDEEQGGLPRSREGRVDESPVSYRPAEAYLVTRITGADGETREERQILIRGEDLVLIRDLAGEDRAAFRRKPVYRNRLTGFLIEHGEDAILQLDSGDLSDEGFGDTWNELVLFGLRRSDVAGLAATGEKREAFGHSFSRLAAADEYTSLREVDWNEELGLPLKVRWKHGSVQVEREVVGLEVGLDAVAFLDPTLRYPGYKVMDLSDWREEHHGCAKSDLAIEHQHEKER